MKQEQDNNSYLFTLASEMKPRRQHRKHFIPLYSYNKFVSFTVFELARW